MRTGALDVGVFSPKGISPTERIAVELYKLHAQLQADIKSYKTKFQMYDVDAVLPKLFRLETGSPLRTHVENIEEAGASEPRNDFQVYQVMYLQNHVLLYPTFNTCINYCMCR